MYFFQNKAPIQNGGQPVAQPTQPQSRMNKHCMQGTNTPGGGSTGYCMKLLTIYPSQCSDN